MDRVEWLRRMREGDSPVNDDLLQDFKLVLQSLSDQQVLALTAPFFQAPHVLDQMDGSTTLRSVGNSEWMKSFKPRLALEARLTYLVGLLEGQLRTPFCQ
jgi:hypothetical protein